MVRGQQWEVYDFEEVKDLVQKRGEIIMVTNTPDYSADVISLDADGVKTVALLYESWKSRQSTGGGDDEVSGDTFYHITSQADIDALPQHVGAKETRWLLVDNVPRLEHLEFRFSGDGMVCITTENYIQHGGISYERQFDLDIYGRGIYSISGIGLSSLILKESCYVVFFNCVVGHVDIMYNCLLEAYGLEGIYGNLMNYGRCLLYFCQIYGATLYNYTTGTLYLVDVVGMPSDFGDLYNFGICIHEGLDRISINGSGPIYQLD